MVGYTTSENFRAYLHNWKREKSCDAREWENDDEVFRKKQKEQVGKEHKSKV